MKRSLRVTPAALGWLGLALLLGAAALLARGLAPTLIDWQPSRASAEPWRVLTAVAVHYSELHLAANLAGTLVVGALGWAVPVSWRAAIAWAAAWPLTQVGLLAQPALTHYGGLSGVLHAGVAVVGVELLAHERGIRRAIGVALLVGLAVKVVLEAPWQGPLRHPAGWDIAVAPFAHLTGLVAGIGCAVALLPWRSLHRR